MHSLNCIPVLGFETTNYHDVLISKEISANLNLDKNDSFTSWNSRNVYKLAGYIPIVGTIVGIMHLIKIQNINSTVPLTNRCSWITRSTVELLSLGFLLLIPDLLATLYRLCLSPTKSSLAETLFKSRLADFANCHVHSCSHSSPYDIIELAPERCRITLNTKIKGENIFHAVYVSEKDLREIYDEKDLTKLDLDTLCKHVMLYKAIQTAIVKGYQKISISITAEFKEASLTIYMPETKTAHVPWFRHLEELALDEYYKRHGKVTPNSEPALPSEKKASAEIASSSLIQITSSAIPAPIESPVALAETAATVAPKQATTEPTESLTAVTVSHPKSNEPSVLETLFQSTFEDHFSETHDHVDYEITVHTLSSMSIKFNPKIDSLNDFQRALLTTEVALEVFKDNAKNFAFLRSEIKLSFSKTNFRYPPISFYSNKMNDTIEGLTNGSKMLRAMIAERTSYEFFSAQGVFVIQPQTDDMCLIEFKKPAKPLSPTHVRMLTTLAILNVLAHKPGCKTVNFSSEFLQRDPWHRPPGEENQVSKDVFEEFNSIAAQCRNEQKTTPPKGSRKKKNRNRA